MGTSRRTERPATSALALLAVLAALALPGPGRAQEPSAAPPAVVIEARFVDRETGLEAEWGATGQVLLPAPVADPALAHWRGARAVATTPSRQGVVVPAGQAGTLRVGREAPFAGWFFRFGARAGFVDPEAEWRDVETLLGVEVLAAEPGGAVRLALTPEFAFQHGRARRGASFPTLRVEVVLADGEESVVRTVPGERAFFDRFLAGYDPLRRVRPVDLLLRASVAPRPAP